MGYVALYNKYRPKTFDDVCGQEKVVKILSSMVLQNKVSNGYLLCGNRGLGKTTLAKIFSKAINCDNVDDNGNPCNECVSCRAVNDGKSMDVIELDAASNRGVDTIRERVINKVQFKPSSRYRIFILDEVHMLTTEAWNAMLKTLEEPPEYCVFLFCTTNPEKIPKTIMSRIQRFNLSDMTNENIVSRLKYISEKESIDVADDALYLIARYAKGGMRDSISALDQLSTDGETITVETINDMFGLLPEDIVFNLLENIVNKDLKKSIELISTV
jgi:DNA polymerase-3 subunit gamma/tau